MFTHLFDMFNRWRREYANSKNGFLFLHLGGWEAGTRSLGWQWVRCCLSTLRWLFAHSGVTLRGVCDLFSFWAFRHAACPSSQLTADNLVDIVAANQGSIVFFRNLGNGSFSSSSSIVATTSSGTGFASVAAADIDLDGLPDLIGWVDRHVRCS